MGDLGDYDGNDAAVGVLVDGVTSNIETADIQTQEARHYNADQGTIGAATIRAAERPRDGGVASPVVVAGRAMDGGANSVVFGVAEATAVGSDAAAADGAGVGGVGGQVSNTQAYRRRSCLADSLNVHVPCEREDTGTGSGSRILQVLEEERTASDAATTPSRTTPILLQDVYINKLVAFCPDKEKWMKAKAYRPAGTAYIIGRVCRQGKKGSMLRFLRFVGWIVSSRKRWNTLVWGVLQRGIKNYSVLIRMKNPDWRILVQPDPTDDIDFEENDSNCEEEEVFKSLTPLSLFLQVLKKWKLFETCDLCRLEKLRHHHTCFNTKRNRPELTCAQSSSICSSIPQVQVFCLHSPIFLAPSFARDEQVLYGVLLYDLVKHELHCQRSDVMHRLGGVINQSEAQSLSDQLAKLEKAKIQQHVLEVTRPLYGTNRIVNMDNYYTSVQLLQGLHLKGLYGRGTVRSKSKHYPVHSILHEADCVRGDYRQSVSHDHIMLAVSWCDGNIVNMLSNADSPTVTSVTRLIGSEKQSFPAPECIAQYNTNMQGVDRLDQIRGRFSIADGHSFKNWHKKLSLALIDMARSNAYLTRRLVTSEQGKSRDPHRDFVIELIGKLISGQWKNAPNDDLIFYSGETLDDGDAEHVVTPSLLHQEDSAIAVATTACDSVSSRQIHGDSIRKRRRCIVCRWEERYPTQVTTYCVTHGVCLCQEVHEDAEPWMCPSSSLTCWDKYHQFYYPQGLFTDKGNVRRGSELNKLKVSLPVPKPKTTKRKVARQLHDARETSPRSSGGSVSGASERDGGVGPLEFAAFGLGGGGSIHGLVAFARSSAAFAGDAALGGGAAALGGDAALGGGEAALGGDTPHDGSAVVLDGG
ncbi:unnamed protein product [Phytophthora fragariaefolia]|uniref:Unnamed protein product n=1 Tax=Phytophthora fragariaefolia TaxID=1490495 RepID=A0A9W6XQ19_9STRA|nr:unnamed protein product [Phytophthora fragariaefolia]